MIQAAKQPKTDASTPWIKQHSQGTKDNAIALPCPHKTFHTEDHHVLDELLERGSV